MVEIKFIKINPKAVTPKKAYDGDSGFDLYSLEDLVLMPNKPVVIGTGLAFEIPEGYEIQVRSRSGYSLKDNIVVNNSPGTIDSGYRGELGVILLNQSHHVKHIKVGDKIAQAVVCELPKIKFVEKDSITATERNMRGFGSSGK